MVHNIKRPWYFSSWVEATYQVGWFRFWLSPSLGTLKREKREKGEKNVDAGKLNYKQPLLDIIAVGRYSNP